MEVAHGDYGDMVNKLVVAVQNGKCTNWNLEKVNTCADIDLAKTVLTLKNAAAGKTVQQSVRQGHTHTHKNTLSRLIIRAPLSIYL